MPTTGIKAVFATCVTLCLMQAPEARSAQPGAWAYDEIMQLPKSVAPAMPGAKPAVACESLLNTRLSERATVSEARIEPGKDGAAGSCQVTIEVASPSAPNIVTVWLA